MSFDVNETITGMLNAIKGEVKNDWHLVKDTANDFLISREERLQFLFQERLTKEIDEAFFIKMLEEEKKILESELNAMAVISEAIAQKAANAAIDVLQKAIEGAIHF